MAVAQIEIPTDVLDSARLSVQEVKQELALALYAQRRLSIGKSRELAGLSLWEFRQLLGSRHIPPHYDESDLAEDLAVLSELRQAES
ncbi:UPF0175 family protein [Candidatus Thiodictyon syntrophicum]|jgi:predicted HTH domain antitoxin|uniref:Uncharacterized protein n=1 Tax=Candidatus Thiodictyon syntrophicum TaxID=1166950 RepID=A0A2K8U8R2_9GAMM|nr:UPF0175 family protein [Candidatus Thiodictyon syntrophicum]AUB81799.1 hypothetical protein THSYN_13075 [Candidatus Thiodictyon syntrophicum]